MNKDQVIAAVRKFSQSPFQVCLTDLKRPNEPEGNLICNAPRPIIGERLDYSEYLRGRFWTSIDPSSEMAGWKVQDVIDMKGVFVVFVTAQEIEAWAAKYAEKNDLDIEEFDYATKRQSFFHNHEESIIPMKCFRCRREVKHPHMINGHVFGRCCAEFVGESPQIAIEWRKVEPKVLTDRERIASVDWAKVTDSMVAEVLAILGKEK